MENKPVSNAVTDIKINIKPKWEKRVSLILLFIIVVFGAWVRFNNISRYGIYPFDGVSYTEEALRWASGQSPSFIEGRFYRPVSFFLQGMALRVFGYNDYSIKLMHGILDLFSLVLIFFTALKLTRSPWPGLGACLVYAFLPGVILLAKRELLHTETTFFTLLAVFFLVIHITADPPPGKGKVRNDLMLALSGFFLGLAANTHADQAFLAVGMVLYLFFSTFRTAAKGTRVKRFVMLAAIFSAGFFIPFVVGFLLLGPQKAWAVFSREAFDFVPLQKARYESVSPFVLFYHIIVHTLNYFFTQKAFMIGMLLLGGGVIISWRRIKKLSAPSGSYLPLFLILTYITSYSLLFVSFAPHLGRVLLPIIPLFLIFLFQWYYLLITGFRRLTIRGRPIGTAVFIGLALILFVFVPKNISIKGEIVRQTDFRYVYDLLKSKVDNQNKLLVSPATLKGTIDRGFRCNLYFGANAIYQNRLPLEGEYTLEKLQDLLNGLSIRYVWVGKTIDYSLMNSSGPPHFKNWLYNKSFHYTVEKDLDILQRYVRKRDGILLNKSKLGELYILTDNPTDFTNPATILPNGSFQYWEKDLPMGGWKLVSGKVSVSHSLCLEPDEEKGSRLACGIPYPLQPGQERGTVVIGMDVRVEKGDNLEVFITTRMKGAHGRIHLAKITQSGTGQWQTLSGQWELTSAMYSLDLNIVLSRRSKRPALVDNLSLFLVEPAAVNEKAASPPVRKSKKKGEK